MRSSRSVGPDHGVDRLARQRLAARPAWRSRRRRHAPGAAVGWRELGGIRHRADPQRAGGGGAGLRAVFLQDQRRPRTGSDPGLRQGAVGHRGQAHRDPRSRGVPRDAQRLVASARRRGDKLATGAACVGEELASVPSPSWPRAALHRFDGAPRRKRSTRGAAVPGITMCSPLRHRGVGPGKKVGVIGLGSLVTGAKPFGRRRLVEALS